MDGCHIDSLPIEVVGKIFSYLGDFDILKVARVSKRWLEAVNCTTLMRDITITVTYESGPEMLIHPTRQFSSFVFVKLALSNAYLEFFKSYGENIRRLMFDSCSVSKRLRKNFYRQSLCENLNILEFRNSCFDIFPCLPKLNLLCLFIGETDKLHDMKTIPWHTIAPNLKELTFGTYGLFGANKKNWKMYRDVAIKFRSITTSLPNWFPYEKDNFLKFNNIRLKRFFVSECSSLHQNLVRKHGTITDLTLVSGFISNEDIVQMCSMLPLLEILQLHDFDRFELHSCFVNIFQMENLKSLSLNYITCSKESMIDALRAHRVGNLRQLALMGVSCEFVDHMFRDVLFQNLCSLSLSDCNFISNATIHYISKHLVYLRDLHLFGCDYLTDESLSLRNKVDYSISNIKGLRRLFIRSCPLITSAGLLSAIKFLELRYLTIDSCHLGKFTISDIKVNNPSIHKFKFI